MLFLSDHCSYTHCSRCQIYFVFFLGPQETLSIKPITIVPYPIICSIYFLSSFVLCKPCLELEQENFFAHSTAIQSP
jgi:hypothetical protein